MPASTPRFYARCAAIQVLYQALVNEQEIAQNELNFVLDENHNEIDQKYFEILVEGIFKEINILDAELDCATDRSITCIDPVEISILRLAVYEFIYCPEVPYRVVLNEAVELAKSLGGEQGYKYVNGVLNKMVFKLRSSEYKAVISHYLRK
ncbi:MAG: transcription antitermination factor NusB [Piscirickettsiaceae bacterium]|nr:transcription antitermination factor NusB [Piscirickettsiaceae bacterium]